MNRSGVALLVILLSVPAVSLTASAQDSTPPAFSIIDARRVGDDLTLQIRANRAVIDVTVQLTAQGNVVGVPDWERAAWAAGEHANWTFRLLKDVDSAALLYRFTEGAGVKREQTANIFVPDAPPPTSTSGTPRLLVVQARLSGSSLQVNLTNAGDVEARNVVISIEDGQQKKIATPFARTLASVPPGGAGQATFLVPEGTAQVVIALEYANRTERTSVAVTGGPSADVGGDVNVTLSTDLPFREVDLGRSVDYAITVRNQGRPSLVQLSVEGLATGYSARFFVGGSAVPSVYIDRNQTRQVTLSITVPNSASEVDRTLDFTLLAHSNGTKAGQLAMGIAVRGVARLEIQSSSDEPTLPPGGEATFRVEVRNTGSAPIFNVELDSRRPYGWTVRTEPRLIDRLDPGDAGSFTVQARAPDVIAGGRYSLDVSAKSGDVVSRIETLSVEVEEGSSSGGWLWLVFLLVIAGILGFGAWWKWRG